MSTEWSFNLQCSIRIESSNARVSSAAMDIIESA